MSTITLEHQSKGFQKVLSEVDKLSAAQQRQLLAATAAGRRLEEAAKRRRKGNREANAEQAKLNRLLATGAKIASAFGVALGGAEIATAVYTELNAEIANTIRLQKEASGKQVSFVEKVTEFTQSTSLSEDNQKTVIAAAKDLGEKIGPGGDVAMLDAFENALPKVGEDKLPEVVEKLDKIVANTGDLNPNQDFGVQAVNATNLEEIFGKNGLEILATLTTKGGGTFNETNESLPELIPAMRLAGDASDAMVAAAAFMTATGRGQRVKPATSAASSIFGTLSAENEFKSKTGRTIKLAGEDGGDRFLDLVNRVHSGDISTKDALGLPFAGDKEKKQFLVSQFAAEGELEGKRQHLADAQAGKSTNFEDMRKLILDTVPGAAEVAAQKRAGGSKDRGNVDSIGGTKETVAATHDTTREEFGISKSEDTGFLPSMREIARFFTGQDTISEINRDLRKTGSEDLASFSEQDKQDLLRDITTKIFSQLEGSELGPNAAQRVQEIGLALSGATDENDLARRALSSGAVSAKAGLTDVEQVLLRRAGATDEEQRGFREASAAGDTEKLAQLVDAAIQRILANPPPQQAEALGEAKKQTALLEQIAANSAPGEAPPPPAPANAGAID